MAKKINKKPIRISGYHLNDSRGNFDFTMNRVFDVLQNDYYTQEKTEFVAKIISGIENNDTSTPWWDNLFSSYGGVQQMSYRIRFVEDDEAYNRFDDPTTDTTLSVQERNKIIALHPEAIMELSEAMPMFPSTNSIVLVKKENLVYRITKIISGMKVPGSLAKFVSGNPLSSWFNQDKSTKLLNDLAKDNSDPAALKKREIEAPLGIVANLYKAFGQNVPKKQHKNVIFVGVRADKKTNYNLFVDRMFVAVRTNVGENIEGAYKFYSFTITTTPGTAFLGDLAYTSKGTLNMATPQYIKDAYHLHYHKNDYLALGQTQYFYYWRDANRNKKPEDAPGPNVGLQRKTSRGVNVHRSGTRKNPSASKPISGPKGSKSITAAKYVDGKWTSVETSAYTYSAGCQVFSDPTDFANFMELIKTDHKDNGVNKWDYFLLREKEFQSLMKLKGGKIDEVKQTIEKIQKEKGIEPWPA